MSVVDTTCGSKITSQFVLSSVGYMKLQTYIYANDISLVPLLTLLTNQYYAAIQPFRSDAFNAVRTAISAVYDYFYLLVEYTIRTIAPQTYTYFQTVFNAYFSPIVCWIVKQKAYQGNYAALITSIANAWSELVYGVATQFLSSLTTAAIRTQYLNTILPAFNAFIQNLISIQSGKCGVKWENITIDITQPVPRQ